MGEQIKPRLSFGGYPEGSIKTTYCQKTHPLWKLLDDLRPAGVEPNLSFGGYPEGSVKIKYHKKTHPLWKLLEDEKEPAKKKSTQ